MINPLVTQCSSSVGSKDCGEFGGNTKTDRMRAHRTTLFCQLCRSQEFEIQETWLEILSDGGTSGRVKT